MASARSVMNGGNAIIFPMEKKRQKERSQEKDMEIFTLYS